MNVRAKNYCAEIETLADMIEIKNELNPIVYRYKCNMVVFCSIPKRYFNRFLTELVMNKIPYDFGSVGALTITIGYICFRVRRQAKFDYKPETIQKIMDRRTMKIPLKEISAETKIPITSLRNIIKEQLNTN